MLSAIKRRSPACSPLPIKNPKSKIQNLFLPPGRQIACLRLFALAHEAAFYACGSFADGTRDLIHQGLGYKKTGSLQLCKHWPASRYQAASFRQGHQAQRSSLADSKYGRTTASSRVIKDGFKARICHGPGDHCGLSAPEIPSKQFIPLWHVTLDNGRSGR